MKYKRAAFCTLGCKVNFYDSEAMEELFRERGYEVVDFDEFADIYVINTCTVTNFGDKKSRQAIRRAKRLNPNAIVIAAGCYTQTAPEEIAKIEGVNILIGTDNRRHIVDIAEGYNGKGVLNCVDNIMKVKDFERLSVESLKDRTRAFIKIQEGCNRFCTYCMIPFARGPVRSRDLDDILSEVERLAAGGFKEVVLTGIHIASYGLDKNGTGLARVLEKVCEVKGIERVRFSSVEPVIINEEFLGCIKKLPQICHHFHLSLQSGSDKVLKAMNRRYTAEEYYKACNMLRELWEDTAITTDIIAGFPGESEEDFEKSVKLAKKCELFKIHAFPYSPKKGTVAARMGGQIEAGIKQNRVKRLLEVSEENSRAFMKRYIGKTEKVLFERLDEQGFYEGHTSNYINVRVKSSEDLVNTVLNVRLMDIISEGNMLGEVVYN